MQYLIDFAFIDFTDLKFGDSMDDLMRSVLIISARYLFSEWYDY